MTAWTLQVIWPIHDFAMTEAEAIHDAWLELPAFAEKRQVTIADRPQMRVVDLNAEQRAAFRASRAVVCLAPVIKRASTTTSYRSKEAA